MSDALTRLETLREARQLATLGSRPDNAGGQSEAQEAIFSKGVSINFLCKIFRMSPNTVREKLARCEPIPGTGSAEGKQRNYRYDLATAASYLVMPKLSPEQVLTAIRTSDLPPTFQQQFWTARLKQQEWEERAGDLWRTEKVRSTLGTTFQTMKFTMQLWLDTVEMETGLTDKQREIVTRLVDGLQKDIYERLVANIAAQSTESQMSEHPNKDYEAVPDDAVPEDPNDLI